MSAATKTSVLFTVGHSNHGVEKFLQILSANSVEVLVDVRSAPYSKWVPQFNKRDIEKAASDAGFKYIFMGDVIGGKPSNPEFLDKSGKVMYAKIAISDTFQQGIDRLISGIEDGWKIALMCAEAEPLNCHRHLLIAKELELSRTISVCHICSDGSRLEAKKHLNPESQQLMLF